MVCYIATGWDVFGTHCVHIVPYLQILFTIYIYINITILSHLLCFRNGISGCTDVQIQFQDLQPKLGNMLFNFIDCNQLLRTSQRYLIQ